MFVITLKELIGLVIFILIFPFAWALIRANKNKDE